MAPRQSPFLVQYAVEVVGSAAREGRGRKKKKGLALLGLCKGDLVKIERRLFEIC